MRTALAALAVIAGCESKTAAPTPAPVATTPRDAKLASPDAPVPVLRGPVLPGTLWFVEEGTPQRLARLTAGTRSSLEAAGGDLFPSRWSLPDGSLVVIASKGDGSPDSEQLALVTPAGEVTRVGPTAPMIRDPAVDPRGRWIVFTSNADGHSDLYRIELATKQTTRLTNDAAGNFTPARLGDGIVFASSRDDNSEIYRIDATGGKARRLTAFHKDDLAPATAPDGTTIAFASDREGPVRIFLMAPDGTKQRRLTTRAVEDGDEIEHAWSPDGTQLAYVLERRGTRSVHVHELTTGKDRELTPAAARDADPTFSPDGAWLAVARSDGAIWAVSLRGGAPVRVSSGRLPRWH